MNPAAQALVAKFRANQPVKPEFDCIGAFPVQLDGYFSVAFAEPDKLTAIGHSGGRMAVTWVDGDRGGYQVLQRPVPPRPTFWQRLFRWFK
jgi:hypothetical protein